MECGIASFGVFLWGVGNLEVRIVAGALFEGYRCCNCGLWLSTMGSSGPYVG